MGNQPHELNPSAYDQPRDNRSPTVANLPAVAGPAVTSRPVSTTHQCPNCGAWAPTGSSICGECGARIQPKPAKIRCRLCGANASASLVICPSCGRELQAAPSRVLSWGAPAVLVLLFFLVVVQRWENGNPVHWLQAGVVTSSDWINQMAQQLDPQITISTLPATVGENNSANSVVADNPAFIAEPNVQADLFILDPDRNNSTDSITSFAEENSGNQENGEQGSTSAEQSANGLIEAVAVIPTVAIAEPTATATDLPTPQPTATATTPAPTATAQPTATATPRQPATSAVVQALPSADRSETVDAANVTARQIETTTVTILQPTPTAVPTETAPPPQASLTYAVQAGDTPLGIAGKFNIDVDKLLAANGLSVNDARRLRVGQVLTIPADAEPTATPQPTATPTAMAVATATAAAPTPTTTAKTLDEVAVVSAAQGTVRLDAPVLRSPENEAFFSCGANNVLAWLPVAYIRDTDQYLLHLGFLSGYNSDGSEQVTWILEQWRPANATLWNLDESLCGLAPQSFGRQWRWYVEVIEAAGGSRQRVSPASSIWGFSWN